LKEVPATKKVQAVKEFWSGLAVTEIAKRHGVSRDSVYRWAKRAEEAMKVALDSPRKSCRVCGRYPSRI